LRYIGSKGSSEIMDTRAYGRSSHNSILFKPMLTDGLLASYLTQERIHKLIASADF